MPSHLFGIDKFRQINNSVVAHRDEVKEQHEIYAYLKYCESNGYVKNNPLSFYKYEEWIYNLYYNENFYWVNSCIFKVDNWGAIYGWGTQRRFYTSIASYFTAEFGIDVLEFRKQVNSEGYYVYTPEYNQYLLEHSGTILNLENILRANDYDNSVEAMYDRLE